MNPDELCTVSLSTANSRVKGMQLGMRRRLQNEPSFIFSAANFHLSKLFRAFTSSLQSRRDAVWEGQNWSCRYCQECIG